MNDDSERAFADLRPAALDEMAGDAFARRRDADLAHAMRAVPGKAARSRRPMLLAAGLAAGAVAVGGVVVLADGGDTGTGTAAVQSPSEVLDARAVLLASARKAAQAPATTGRYWYDRERITSRVSVLVKKGKAAAGKPSRTPLPFTAHTVHTQEHWLARDKGDTTRSVVGIDREDVFATPSDEAKWRKMGAPELEPWSRKRKVNDYREPMRQTIGNKKVTFAELAKLPGNAAGLEAELRRRHTADVNDPKYPLQDGFTQYVWATAQDLLSGPIPPAVRGALYQVLAKQPGLRAGGRVKDRQGRSGVAIVMPAQKGSRHVSGDDLAEYRLIVSPDTGRLLAYETRAKGGALLLSVVHEESGWTGKLGARP
ncbi:CU044_5270 family protein [Spirillospora sp. NPDC050679]